GRPGLLHLDHPRRAQLPQGTSLLRGLTEPPLGTEGGRVGSALPSDGRADPFHDLVSLVLADLVELVVQVPALVGVQRRASLPYKIARERFVVLTLVIFYAPQHATWALSAAEFVDQRVIGDLCRHRVLLWILWNVRRAWDFGVDSPLERPKF